MTQSISNIQECILDCDGSCRDFNFISPDRVAVSILVSQFVEKYRPMSAYGNDGNKIDNESIAKSVLDLSGSSAIQLSGKNLDLCIQQIQLFLCVTSDDEIDVEITFFPQDIDIDSFEISSFLNLILSWQTQANANEGFLRYENASWKHGDTNPGSGIIYVSKST